MSYRSRHYSGMSIKEETNNKCNKLKADGQPSTGIV
jgi:hypothetical protein